MLAGITNIQVDELIIKHSQTKSMDHKKEGYLCFDKFGNGHFAC